MAVCCAARRRAGESLALTAAMNPTEPDHPESDETLAIRSRQGDLAAFETLIQRYRQEMLRFLVRFLRDRHAAEDVFQETFLQIHQSLDSFDTDRSFRPWLFTIAANKARDHLRRHRRQPTLSLSASVPQDHDADAEQSFTDLLRDDLPLPEQTASEAEMSELVGSVVASLPDHLREVLVLAYFHQFAYRQIAEMLGVPLGTVKSRLHAAVGTFAEIWKSRFEMLGSQENVSAR